MEGRKDEMEWRAGANHVELVYPVEALLLPGALALEGVLGFGRIVLSCGRSGKYLVVVASRLIFACCGFSRILAAISAFFSPSDISCCIARLNFSCSSSSSCALERQLTTWYQSMLGKDLNHYLSINFCL